MFPSSKLNSKKFIKDSVINIKIQNGKYIPNYELPRDIISENEIFDMFEYNKIGVKINLNEEEIINQLINKELNWFRPYNINDYLLFIHWYERRYKKNIINKNILINLNDFTRFLPTKNNENKLSKLYSFDEITNLITNNIEDLYKSKKHENFSIIYEIFYNEFPNIENFEFTDLFNENFVKYLLNLYPNISGISTDKIHYIRFSYEELSDYNSYDNIDNGLNYLNKHNLPSFIPKKLSLKSPISEIENILRELKGIPKIGEGWVNETTLYYLIKNSFPSLNVIHHGKPEWLGRQHFDIWIPELKCGIEYQGKQHSEPVDFFGGVESFIKNKERDELKKNKCIENNTILIEVFPDYKIELIIDQIKYLITSTDNK